mmetsp:Transcript_20608/g.59083  ORF Transcript_20608/g.59083 Transcript_20608/m.59083 type:complete len:248 (-) Transcript_20608:79-822(-)
MLTRRKGALPVGSVGAGGASYRREFSAWVLLGFLHVLLWTKFSELRSRSSPHRSALTWVGGHPPISREAKCWCSADSDGDESSTFLRGDAMAPTSQSPQCTPSLAIDAILTSGHDHIWLVERKDTNQYACMGGFVELNESAEEAVLRELEEETGVALTRDEANPKFFGLYSDPRRDNRRPTASIIYVLDIPLSYKPKGGDDAKGVKRVALADIDHLDFFADHLTILLDYRESTKKLFSFGSKEGLCM